MTEVFRDARKDAGYCPKCQKGYAIGPHVCPSELPPSKERTAEPQFMRAYAFYLRKPAREHGLSQSYLDSLADEIEAAANEIEKGRNAPELRRWKIEPAPFDGVDFKVSESGEWVRWEDVRPYLRTAYEPAASKERVSDEKLASLIEACDHNFDVSEQYGATDMSLWENLSEALEELKERRTAPVNWAIDALSTSHEPCPECEKRKHANDRVNYETTEDGFRICRGYHHRSADCEWEYYVRRPSQPPSADARDLVVMLRKLQDWIQHLYSCERQRWGRPELKRCTCGLQPLLDEASTLIKRVESPSQTKEGGQ